MGSIPEGVKTVSGEGSDVKSAVIAAAEVLGVEPRMVGYELDLAHFRSQSGGSLSRRTVKVVAWVDEARAAAPAPAPAPAKAAEEAPEAEADASEEAPKKPRGRGRAKKDAEPAAEPEAEAAAPAPAPRAEPIPDNGARTDASIFAETWFQKLVELMGLTGTVSATGTSDRIRLKVEVDHAGRIIGRRGATLAAIRHLLKLAMADQGDFTIDVDIPDERGDREERRPRSDDRGDRGDRGDRRDRDRGDRRDRRDRGDRGDRGDRRGGRGRRDRDEPKGEYPEEKLQMLARRAAEKALETGKPVTINKPFNSHDRRIIHVEVSEIDGVESNSVIKDGQKFVQITPELMVDED